MVSKWMRDKLIEDGLGLIFYDFDPVSSHMTGVIEALRSSRLWQAQLVSPAFEIPSSAKEACHLRTDETEDAVAFLYQTSNYEVRSFHNLGLIALIVRTLPSGPPLNTTRAELEAGRLAHSIFGGNLPKLRIDERSGDGIRGTRALSSPKPEEELEPVDRLTWWTEDGEWGFAVPKARPIDPLRPPSTLGFSHEQFQAWFDTFGARRY